MTIYLYVKTHRKTGLKYLGKTERNPFKYKGSGKYWKNHLRVHGNEVDTKILRECKTNDEVREWGLYYSNMWNVVESDQWANIREEAGDGFTSEDARKKWDNKNYREKMCRLSKENAILLRPDVQQKMKEINSIRGKKEFESGTSSLLRPEVIEKSLKKLKDRIELNVKNGTWGYQNSELANRVNSENRVKIAEGKFHTQTEEFAKNQSKIQKNLVESGNHMTQVQWTCHCGKTGKGISNYNRWHGENCKYHLDKY